MMRHILLVEDNPSDEKLTLMALEKQNLTQGITVVRDGVEALDYLYAQNTYSERNPLDLPQLVILDLKLPKVNGLEVLARIRNDAATKLLPVVILTSSAEDKDLVESYRLGVNSYVQKPVNFNDFLEAVKQLGLYWLFLNYNPPLGAREASDDNDASGLV
jgi:two-component system, response regulator